MRVTVCIRRFDDNLEESFIFYHMSPGSQIQVMGLAATTFTY